MVSTARSECEGREARGAGQIRMAGEGLLRAVPVPASDAPFAGITQIRFDGYDLSRSHLCAGTPCHACNVNDRVPPRNAGTVTARSGRSSIMENGMPEPARLSDLPDAHIASVGQFVSYLEQHGNFDGLVFRGQRVDMPLVPKLSRLEPRGTTRAELERVMLNEFKRTAPPHLDIQPTNTVEWLSVARHYGMAT